MKNNRIGFELDILQKKISLAMTNGTSLMPLRSRHSNFFNQFLFEISICSTGIEMLRNVVGLRCYCA